MSVGLRADGERQDQIAGGLPARPGELCRGLGPAAAAGGGGVGDRSPGGWGGSLLVGEFGDGPCPSGVGMDLRPRCRRARRGCAPSPTPHRSTAGPPARATTTASSASRSASAAGESIGWHATPRASRAPDDGRRHLGPVGDDRARPRRGGREVVGGRLVEQRSEAGVAAAAAHLVGLGRGQGDGGRGLQQVGQRRHVVAAHHLDQPGLVDHRDFGSAGEEHPPVAGRERRRCTRWAPSGPRSSGAGIEPSDSPPVAAPLVGWLRPSAAATMRVAAIGEMALITTPVGSVPTQLPGE